MARDTFPVRGSRIDREAWWRRQIALGFGMTAHHAMRFLQGVCRECYAQGRAAGRVKIVEPEEYPAPAAPRE